MTLRNNRVSVAGQIARRLGLATIGATAALMLSAGCLSAGQSPLGGGPSGNQPPPAPPGGPIPAGLVDPCSLLTTNEVSTIAGSPVFDGVRDAEEDGTFVVCRWFATNDDLRIAAVVNMTLLVVNDAMKSNIESDLLSGKGQQLDQVGNNTVVQAADLSTVGNSYAAGWKSAAFYRLQCNTPTGGRPSKAICTEAVTAAAARLP